MDLVPKMRKCGAKYIDHVIDISIEYISENIFDRKI